MRMGTFQLHSIPPWSTSTDVAREQFAQMQAAEDAGFHELWLAEHNSRDYGMIGNTAALATALAVATTNIRISTAVCRLPLHNPLHVAEDLAYADVMSGGRVDLGVGRGYDLQEFGSYGVPFEERDERWQESFNAIRQIWRTGQTEFAGNYHRAGQGKFLPVPLTPGGPPIYVMVSGSASSIKMAAELLLPIASGSGPTPEELRTRLDMYAQLASDAGHDDQAIGTVLNNCWQLKPMHAAETTEQAITEYRRGLEWYMAELSNRSMYGFARELKPYEYFVEHQSVLLGSAEKLAEDLADYCDRSGINNVICWINMGGQPHEQVLTALEIFGAAIIPKLRDYRFDWTRQRTATEPGRYEPDPTLSCGYSDRNVRSSGLG
jgi:alkanesulfonate monooxygenase SsuD/methylene tetrahydromethanopterin reductase-like flavin-dependent oxidoreductase (luciferase family)